MSWTPENEIKLIKLFKNKTSLEEIAVTFNKDVDCILTRLQKIIYENKNSGKTYDFIANILNLPVSEVINYYEEYRKLKDVNSGVVSNNIQQQQSYNCPNCGCNAKEFNISDKLDLLDMENKFMKLFLENKILHEKIKILVRKEKLNPNILEILKNVREEIKKEKIEKNAA